MKREVRGHVLGDGVVRGGSRVLQGERNMWTVWGV